MNMRNPEKRKASDNMLMIQFLRISGLSRKQHYRSIQTDGPVGATRPESEGAAWRSLVDEQAEATRTGRQTLTQLTQKGKRVLGAEADV